jgi:hypothetical protein
MSRMWSITALLATMTLPQVRAQNPPAPPAGKPPATADAPPSVIVTPVNGPSAPLLVLVTAIDTKLQVILLESEVQERVIRYRPVEEKREFAGRVETRVVQVPILETRSEKRRYQWSTNGNQAFDAAGEKLQTDRLWERVKPGATVLLLEGKSLDMAWQKILKPEVVILTQRTIVPIPPGTKPPPPAR